MGYLTIDLECSECLRDLEFTQKKQVLTVKPCICKDEKIEADPEATQKMIKYTIKQTNQS